MNEDQADTLTMWEAFKMFLKAIAILFLIIGSLMLFSCNTVKKSTTRTESKADSTGRTTTDSAKVIKANSAETKKEQGNYEKVTVYAYDTIYYIQPGRTDTIIKYVPRIITVYEKGSYNKAESAIKSNSDSGGVKQDQSATVSKEVKEVKKDKKSSRFPWWWIAIVVIVVGGIYAGWRYYK